MNRFVVSSGWALLGLAALTAASAGGARAGDYGRHGAGIPGIGPGTGVDVYIPNPDEQTPIAWSQGTEPPPPQGDYGGGTLQYMITGNETRPVPHPRVPPPYFPARVAPVNGPDGRSSLASHARPPRGAYGYAAAGPRGGDEGGYAPPPPPPPGYGAPRPYRDASPAGGDYGGFGFGAPVPHASVSGPRAAYVPAAYAPEPGEGGVAAPAAEPPQAAIDPMFRRQDVAYAGGQGPGTIVIDTASKFLYLVEGGGHALRYGIGVAKPGFLWSGTHTITAKREWPDWTPPAEMLGRRPDLPRHMAGGIENPLGARAMYLGSTLYRIHGTNEPNTIGTNVSSGCIRLLNEDVADLYGRVRVGTRVVVM
jgi:lipoprotein-anchoring transpeptidase ErfK/SrfK